MATKVVNRINKNKRIKEINALAESHQWTKLISSITESETFSVKTAKDIDTIYQVSSRLSGYSELNRRYKVNADKKALTVTVTVERV